MSKFCLIGQNIKTSLSPLIHNSLFKLKSSNNRYFLYNQNQFLPLNQFQKQNIQGISITIPFKQNYKHLTSINYDQGISKQKNVINTLIRDKNQNFQAYNTDIFGIQKCLKNHLIFSNNQIDQTAILIGAGATAQIFAYYLHQRKIKVLMVNRTVQKLIKIQQQYQNIVKVIPIKKNIQINSSQSNLLYLSSNLLVINTLPTKAAEQNIEYLIQVLRKYVLKMQNIQNLTFMDVNYRDIQQNLKSKMIKLIVNQFKSKIQVKFVNGINMLVWQAIQQNRLFCQEPAYNQKQYLKQFQYLEQILNFKNNT